MIKEKLSKGSDITKINNAKEALNGLDKTHMESFHHKLDQARERLSETSQVFKMP